jgi:ABC-type amino acid transport substrate-binding protein
VPDELGPSLLAGKIDLIANNYWPTPERERLYAFTMPYFVRGGVGSLWVEGTGRSTPRPVWPESASLW